MYAHIQTDTPETQNGIVFELIEPYFRPESDRPSMPEELSEDATDEERVAYAVAMALHSEYPAGEEVNINARFPPEIVANIHPCNDDVRQGWRYENGVYSEPAPYVAPPMTEAQALAERSNRLDYATRQINPLQDLVDIGEATPKDEAELLAWKKYRAAIGKVNTQEGFPADVVWPAAPGV